ncbi:hypothetical protein GGU10DRAFT_434867 [Lentinula aff. detonsa]|uniref:Uncharacterized protein n=1 Tax=Lentinula aff. detonsa TaxID=2804958 RepID=A0AA38NLV0_9AGAR|nr:hypothetical protein GGU10DRAFT_434867 [Lentinula aff. detonsa]
MANCKCSLRFPAGRESSTALISAFVTIHTFSWTSCLIIVVTVVLSPNIRRQSTWINLNISWIIACFIYAFLLTTEQLYKTNPQPGVCLFQAAAVDAVSSLVAGAMLALALQLWYNLRSNSVRPILAARQRDLLLIAMPYVVPLIEFFATLGYAVQHPQQVTLTESGMFCGLTTPIPGKISSLYSAILMIPTVSAQALLWVYSYQNWYKVSGNSGNALATMIRLGLFTLFGIVGVMVSIFNLTNQVNPSVVNILESLPPLSFVFIFGLQQDLLHTWMFWRQPTISQPTTGAWSRIQIVNMQKLSEVEQSRPSSATKPTWGQIHNRLQTERNSDIVNNSV